MLSVGFLPVWFVGGGLCALGLNHPLFSLLKQVTCLIKKHPGQTEDLHGNPVEDESQRSPLHSSHFCGIPLGRHVLEAAIPAKVALPKEQDHRHKSSDCSSTLDILQVLVLQHTLSSLGLSLDLRPLILWDSLILLL